MGIFNEEPNRYNFNNNKTNLKALKKANTSLSNLIKVLFIFYI